MKDGPDIAHIAALIGDPARANMLAALMSGKALTARELAEEAGVAASTASGHLGKLREGGLVLEARQGRHRYVTLSSPEVAEVLEALMGLAAQAGHTRTRTGPRDPALRESRICYDHLAGERGVALLDALLRQGLVRGDEDLELTEAGATFFQAFGVDVAGLAGRRRPLCRACLDWSQRRMHLGGALGAALWQEIARKGWAARVPDSRLIRFTPQGAHAFEQCFRLA